jgi:hypothetical protein
LTRKLQRHRNRPRRKQVFWNLGKKSEGGKTELPVLKYGKGNNFHRVKVSAHTALDELNLMKHSVTDIYLPLSIQLKFKKKKKREIREALSGTDKLKAFFYFF